MSWKTFGWKLINNRISPYLKLTSWLLGACEGDSGSPVIRRISVSGRGRPFYQQDFIVSTGLDCRLRATIYIRVSQRKVLHWIQKISGTQPVVMVVGGFSSHSKDFLRAKAKVITYILTGTITLLICPCFLAFRRTWYLFWKFEKCSLVQNWISQTTKGRNIKFKLETKSSSLQLDLGKLKFQKQMNWAITN